MKSRFKLVAYDFLNHESMDPEPWFYKPLNKEVSVSRKRKKKKVTNVFVSRGGIRI